MEDFKKWLKMQEMGFGPYIGNCVDTDNYQVMGACSDQNSAKRNLQYRQGFVAHKKVRTKNRKSKNG